MREGEDLSRDGDRPDGVAIRSVEEAVEHNAGSKRSAAQGGSAVPAAAQLEDRGFDRIRTGELGPLAAPP